MSRVRTRPASYSSQDGGTYQMYAGQIRARVFAKGWRVRLRPYCSGNLPLFLSISRPTQDSRTGIPHPHDLPRTKVHAKGDEKAAASDPTALKMAGGGVVAESSRCDAMPATFDLPTLLAQ